MLPADKKVSFCVLLKPTVNTCEFSRCIIWFCFRDLYNGATVSLGVVDVEGDKVLALNAGTVLVVNSHVFALEAQLEKFALGDGNLHLGVFACHLGLNDVIVTCMW